MRDYAHRRRSPFGPNGQDDDHNGHEAVQMVQLGDMKRFSPASRRAKEPLEKIGEPIGATVRSFQDGLMDETSMIRRSGSRHRGGTHARGGSRREAC